MRLADISNRLNAGTTNSVLLSPTPLSSPCNSRFPQFLPIFISHLVMFSSLYFYSGNYLKKNAYETKLLY